MTARFIIGDTRAVLAGLPSASVDLVLCSPPFLALRSYLPANHPDKALEIGSEATPGEFIDTLLDVVEACARVLGPYGTLAFELGDTYSGSGGAGGDYAEGGLRDGQPQFRQTSGWHRGTREGRADGAAYRKEGTEAASPNGGEGWPQAKSLCLIPESFRWALVYGRNPFTGRETPRWRARNVVRWCRPNPPVGALGDKFRPGTSEMVIVCKSAKRWFDLDAVRHEHQAPPHSVGSAMVAGQPRGSTSGVSNPAGAPPLDWWEIPTQGYAGSHYATWPEKLLTRPIEAMCPKFVCTECGEPRRRIVDGAYTVDTGGGSMASKRDATEPDGNARGVHGGPRLAVANTTLGWTDCAHDSYRRGVVLDPFCGSGTTLAVAEGLGRDSIGIDLDSRNADLARERVGMFLTVEDGEGPPAPVDVRASL